MPHTPYGLRATRHAFIHTGLLAFYVLSLPFAAHQFAGHLAESALNQEIEQLRKAGEPMTLAALSFPPVPDAQNAALDLRAPGRIVNRKWNDAQKYLDLDLRPPLSQQDLAKACRCMSGPHSWITSTGPTPMPRSEPRRMPPN